MSNQTPITQNWRAIDRVQEAIVQVNGPTPPVVFGDVVVLEAL